MSDLTKVPPLEGGRPETGPMQFGDDWPGVFIRGDNALLGYLPAVRVAIEALPPERWMEKAQLQGLSDLLGSCSASKHR